MTPNPLWLQLGIDMGNPVTGQKLKDFQAGKDGQAGKDAAEVKMGEVVERFLVVVPTKIPFLLCCFLVNLL